MKAKQQLSRKVREVDAKLREGVLYSEEVLGIEVRGKTGEDPSSARAN
jgi:hypothetical protein